MKLLIVYGTTEGHTRKIARFLRDEAEKAGHTVTLCDTTDKPVSPENFDGVVIGASVHVQKYQSATEHFVKKYHTVLNAMPSAFYSVSLTAASDNQESWVELEKITEDFLKHTSWKPRLVEQVAGALLYTQYDFFKRFIMRMIAKKAGGDTDTSQDYEYTDWDKVANFLNRFLAICIASEEIPAS